MRHPVTLVAAILVFAFSTGMARAQADEQTPDRTITVTGTATLHIIPDTVEWSLTLEDVNADLKAAKASNDKRLAAIVGLRNELDIKIADFVTGNVSIRRVHDREGVFRHYEISRTVRIVQRDTRRFDEYFEKIVSRTDLELDVRFTCSMEIQHRQQARLQAVKAAKGKAAAMAGALEAKVGKVRHLSEGSSRYFYSALSNTSSGETPAADAAAGTFAPGTVSFTVSVEATFDLE